MPIVQTNGINMYYEVHGTGTPLLLIAGLSRSHIIWDDIIPYLSQQHQVIIFDNRGTGQSDKPDAPYSIEMLADDTVGLLKHLNIRSANILGHSMGGFIAMHIAAKHPELVSKLLLCGTCAKTEQQTIDYFTQRKEYLATQPTIEEAIRTVLPWIFSQEFLSAPGHLEALIEKEKSNPHPQPIYAFFHQADACAQHDARHLLKDIKAETLVMCGSADTTITPEASKKMAYAIHNSTVKIIPGSGHMLQVEQPQAFLNLVKDFLS